MSAGERVKESRLRRKWSQKDLAREAGCSQQTIVDIEGKAKPQSKFFTAVICALGESVEWIEHGVGSPGSQSSVEGMLPHLVDFESVANMDPDKPALDQVIDALYMRPMGMSSISFTLGVDEDACVDMADTVRPGQVLFVDPLIEIASGRPVVALVPGWKKAKLRILSSAGGLWFLVADTMATQGVRPFHTLDDYTAALEDGFACPPCLVIGTVAFLGCET